MKAISSYMLSGISVLSLVLIGSCCSPQHSMDSYRGRALALWLDDLRSAETQEDYARASNAVHRIGRNAVPFLLQLSQSTNEPTIQKARPVQFLLKTPLGTDESRLRAALACRAIGSAAEPVIRKLTSELTNNATTSTEIEQQIRAVEVLVNIGPGAFSPLLSVM